MLSPGAAFAAPGDASKRQPKNTADNGFMENLPGDRSSAVASRERPGHA
jgi:hypothetical protein